mgnify:CR=1 FL=1
MKKNILLLLVFYFSLLALCFLLFAFLPGCAAKSKIVKEEELAPLPEEKPKTQSLAVTKLYLGKIQLQDGEYEQAIDNLKLASKLEPDLEKEINPLIAEVEVKLAEKYFSSGEYEKVISALETVKGIDLAKYLPHALLEEKSYCLLAEKFVKEKNYSQAVKIYEQAGNIFLERKNFYAIEIKKLILLERIEKAKGLASSGKHKEALTEYEDLLGDSYMSKSQEMREKRKNIKLAISQICYHLGETAYREGNFSAAEKYWQKSLQFSPNNLKTLQNLGKLYLELKQNTQAKMVYQKILNLGVHTPEVYYQLAELSRNEGNWGEAEKMYNKILNLTGGKGYTQIYSFLGNHYLETKQYKEAVNMYKKYLSNSDVKPAEIYFKLAQALSYLKLYSPAKENYLKAIELDPQLRKRKLTLFPKVFRLYYYLRGWRGYAVAGIVLGSISGIILLLRYYRFVISPPQKVRV